MKIPETLQHRIDLFKDSGRIFQKRQRYFYRKFLVTGNAWSGPNARGISPYCEYDDR